MQFSPIKLLLYFGLCLVPLCAHAQVFKCVDPKTGAKTYSGVPCASADRTTILATPHYPTPSSAVPQQAPVQSAPPARATRLVSATDGSGRAGGGHDKANSSECEEAKRKIAVRNSRVTRFSSDAKEAVIDVRAACGPPPPATIASSAVGGTTVVDAPTHLVNCDPAGCWDTRGRRYVRSGDVLVRPNGGVCTQAGTQWVCP